MAGYNMIRKIRRIEETLYALGMRWGNDRYGLAGEFGDTVGVMPRDDELPQYARDAVLFNGTIEDLDRWLQGIKWARDYDMLIRLSDEKKRARKEQDVRNRQMVQRIKQEDIELINS